MAAALALRYDVRERNRPISVGYVEEVEVFAGVRARYSLRIVDVSESAQHAAVCLIVPQGREHEFVFSTTAGLRQVGSSAGCRRLIAARLNRGQAFENLDAIRLELAECVKAVAPPNAGLVPFVTAGATIGRRVVLEEGTMASDTYVVEEVDCDGLSRRLVFGSNPRVLQTEVGLRKHRKKKKKKVIVDRLRSRYHAAIIAGLVSLSSTASVLLVGLGGGALAQSILEMFESRLVVVELDEKVVDVAVRWFGFEAHKATVQVGDGLSYLDTNDRKFSAVVVDVDAKDASIGMSCPPRAFVEVEYLEKVREALDENGWAVFNVVARDDAARDAALQNFFQVFRAVAVLRPDEDDLNLVVFGSSSTSITTETARDNLRAWLLAPHPSRPREDSGLADLVANLVVLRPRPPSKTYT
ncbi:hypothetical protein CTAYLR_003564 [Chrysophaeum taylorii]|uniref:PABS domain-containing protein n=1 Tax=Chrysophaeum taylorii TaxID=2483200 RepID=A0AAD7UM73_9STRA|nr:hypothetical protein CTAYLR_003564 [Chrysophaeum taylorii]